MYNNLSNISNKLNFSTFNIINNINKKNTIINTPHQSQNQRLFSSINHIKNTNSHTFLSNKRKPIVKINKKIIKLEPLNCHINFKIMKTIPYEEIFKGKNYFCLKDSIFNMNDENNDDKNIDLNEKVDFILGTTNYSGLIKEKNVDKINNSN